MAQDAHPLVIANGKVVGKTIGAVAILPVESRHYLAVGRGYSVDANVLRAMEVRGVEWIEFRHRKSGRRFRISLDAFKANAKPFEYGYGRKLAAPESLYEIISAPAARQING